MVGNDANQPREGEAELLCAPAWWCRQRPETQQSASRHKSWRSG